MAYSAAKGRPPTPIPRVAFDLGVLANAARWVGRAPTSARHSVAYAATCPSWSASKPRIRVCALDACAAAVKIAFLSSRKILIQWAR